MAAKLAAYLDRLFRDDRVLRLPLVVFFALLASAQAHRLFLLLTDKLPPGASSKSLAVAATGANLLFVFMMFWLTAIRSLPNKSADGILPRVYAIAGSFLSLFLSVLPFADLPDGLRILAICLVLLGVVLSLMTVSWLGRSFSICPQSRKLVTSGPYAIVRHPLYVCEQVFVIGIMLDHFSWIALLIVGVQWFCQLQRMKAEEKILTETFPDYEAYARETPALIPRLSFWKGIGATPSRRRLL
jgi:protein-S-isoprenylcysteine O-methyltransferase Ste14